MRKALATLVLWVAGCSQGIEGHYLSDEQYVHLYEEDGILVADFRPSGFIGDAKGFFGGKRSDPKSISLEEQGDAYRGSAPDLMGEVTLSRSDEGLVVVMRGKKIRLTRFKPTDDPRPVDEAATLDAIRARVVAETKKRFEERRGACGQSSLTAGQRALLAKALEAAKFSITGSRLVRADIVWDRYEVDAAMALPAGEQEFVKEKVCAKEKREFLSTRCVAWKERDYSATTKAATVQLVAQVDQSRYPKADTRAPEVALAKIAGEEVRGLNSLLGTDGSRDEHLCKRLLQGSEFLAYTEHDKPQMATK